MQSDDDAFRELSQNIATLYMKRTGNKYKEHHGTDLINTVAFAMNLTPDSDKIKEGKSGNTVFFAKKDIEKIQKIIDAIKENGGSSPGIIIYPLLLQIYSENPIDNVASLPVFCVRNKSGSGYKFIDVTARTYEDHDDFKKNHLLPEGKISYPRNLNFDEDKDGNAIITCYVIDVSKRRALKAVDLYATFVGLGAGALALTGVGAPIAIAGTIFASAYGVCRSTGTLIDRYNHGQSLNPFEDWESFGAWAGIGVTALGVGCSINAFRLTEKISRMAAEGLKISTSTRIAFTASILVPYAVNAGLMITQLIQLAAEWERVPIEYKLITGLQLLFFIGASFKLSSLSISSIEEQVANVAYDQMREILSKEPLGAEKVAAFDRIIAQFDGKYNREAISFFRKVINYDNAVVFAATNDQRYATFGTLEATQENGDFGFRINNQYIIGPEAAIQLGEDMKLALRNNPDIHGAIRVPMRAPTRAATVINPAAENILASRNIIGIERVEQGRAWLQARLNVQTLDNYVVNQVPIFRDMKYHDQIRLRIFPEIERSLTAGLVQMCLRYAADKNIQSVGQYASRYEIFSLYLHKKANELEARINRYQAEHNCTPREAARAFGIQTTLQTESRLTYDNLPKPSMLFSERVNLNSLEQKAIANVGPEIVQQWKTSVEIRPAPVVALPEGNLQTLGQQITALGDLSFETHQHLIGNCSNYISSYENGRQPNFAQTFLREANSTIRSCRGHIASRVVEVTRQKDTNIRRFAFWNLEDGDQAKCTVVCVDKNTGQCRIQNFSTKKISTITTSERNLKDAILEHFETSSNYETIKSEVEGFVSRIDDSCKEYVGSQLIRAWENHDLTLSDLQNLPAIRFASIEHAICHVMKHGGDMSDAQLVSAIRRYFENAQEIIKYSVDHPECVSSEWTQTGSARDFTFYRKRPGARAVEKVVVLVREEGEVIMKTYYEDRRIGNIPPQTKHVEITQLDIRNADLRTFYFQLMLINPRFGVLLPKNYKVTKSTLTDMAMQRNIIIMAGHFFNESGTVNATDLAKAINSAYPNSVNKWNVFALRGRNNCFTNDLENHCLHVWMRGYDFVIFVKRAPEGVGNEDRSSAINRCRNLSMPRDIRCVDSADVDDTIIDVAKRLCGKNLYRQQERDPLTQVLSFVFLPAQAIVPNILNFDHEAFKKLPKEISDSMNECFGQRWNVFIADKMNYQLFYKKYVQIEFDGRTYMVYS